MAETITSLQNPKIKEIVRLRKSSERKEKDLIVIEGRAEIGLAKTAGAEIVALYHCPELAIHKSLESNGEEKIIVIAAAVFKKISLREHPDGWLALAKPRYIVLNEVKISRTPLLLVLEKIEKPGNLGAILRTADAVGADAVMVCDQQTDIYNPNVIRASLGAVFAVPTAVTSSVAAIEFLRHHKIDIYAATPHAGQLYTEVDWRGSAAIIIGAENIGLSQTWLDAATEKIKIPMRGRIDSLNTSVSAAIILFEALRSRQDRTS